VENNSGKQGIVESHSGNQGIVENLNGKHAGGTARAIPIWPIMVVLFFGSSDGCLILAYIGQLCLGSCFRTICFLLILTSIPQVPMVLLPQAERMEAAAQGRETPAVQRAEPCQMECSGNGRWAKPR